MLLDQFGREIQMGDIRTPETREISVQLLRDRYSTYPSSGLTPDRLATILKAADQGDVLRQAELFEEMEEKDAHLASQFQTRKLAVQGLSWEISPTSEDSADKKIAEFCNMVLEGLADLDDHILDMLDALGKGYSMMEIMWDTSSGQANVTGLNWIHAKKLTFWNSIHPRVLTEEDQVQGIDPPPFKFVYHRYKARSGYDTRAGIMRVCAFMYLFKNYAIKDWVSFAEVYGMPIRVGKFEPGASKADKDALINAIRSLGADAAGIISKSTEIEFIESTKTSSLNVYESLVTFCDAQMSKAILGQTLTSEAGGSKGQGSFALGQVHNDVRQDLIEADCRALGKTITQQILRPLVGFNFGWDAPIPQFRFLYEPPEDLKAAADVYKIVSDMGQPISQEHISERFKIPLPKDGETPLKKPTPPPQPFGGMPPGSLPGMQPEKKPPEGPPENNPPEDEPPPAKAKRIAKSVKGGGEPSGQKAIDAMRRKALPKATDEIQAMLKPVLDMIKNAESLEEIGAKIYALYPRLDGERFQQLLARAILASALTGGASEGE